MLGSLNLHFGLGVGERSPKTSRVRPLHNFKHSLCQSCQLLKRTHTLTLFVFSILTLVTHSCVVPILFQVLRNLLQPRILARFLSRLLTIRHRQSIALVLHLASLALTSHLRSTPSCLARPLSDVPVAQYLLSSCSVINSITEFFHPHTIVARLRP